MDEIRYSKAIERTMNEELTEREKLAMLGMGIAGEAGEIVDSLKKVIYHGHELDRDALIKELGDLEWYITHLMKHFEITGDKVRIENIMKLNGRYKNGFSEEESINREL